MPVTEILMLLFYTAIFSFFILRTNFFKRFDLLPSRIMFIFIIKIFAGIFYGYLHRIYYGGGDTMEYFYESKFVSDRLAAHDYYSFLKLTFGINQRPPAADIQPYALAIGYWNDMSSYFIIRFHAISRVISFGFYNVHVVFYNFITLIGLLYLFQFFSKLLDGKKNLIAVIIFFFPSILFFSSGIHKDGFALGSLGLILFFTQKIIVTKNNWLNSISDVCGLLIGIWILIVSRNAWFILLVPVITALFVTAAFPKHTFIKYILILAIYFGVATNLNSFFPDYDFLNMIVLKQNEFKSIPGGNHPLNIISLYPSIISLLMSVPNAIGNCFLEPGITNIRSTLEWGASLENVLVMMFGFLCFFERKKKLTSIERSLFFFCLFFSLLIFIVSGIIVPILGALVRYKMIGVLFLLLAMLVVTDERKFYFLKKGSI